MKSERFIGLQWRLAGLYLATGLLAVGAAGVGQVVGASAGLSPSAALGAGLGAGLAVGLAATAQGFQQVREMKLRLREAGDMAVRIARGDLSGRLRVGRMDEIGLLEEQLNEMADHLEQAVAQLRSLAEQNRRLAEEARRGAALEERARLARDLHDTVNQQLFVLSLRTAAARKRLEQMGGDALAMAPELGALEELARKAHGQMRELILELRPTTLEQQGLGPALEEYVKATAAKEQWQVESAIESGIRLRGAEGEALFRVAQEALNNVAKHARATCVRVALCRQNGSVRLTIADDGAGFDPRAGVRPTAVGLVGMQERLSALGGELCVRSQPGQGTEIIATLPEPEEGGSAHDPHADC